MMDEPDLGLPNRDVLAKISGGNQQMIKWFEDATQAAGLIGTAWTIINDGNDIEGDDPILIFDLET